MALNCKNWGLVCIGSLLFVIFAMSHNVNAESAPDLYDKSSVAIRYRVCTYAGYENQPYNCTNAMFADLSEPTLVDSTTNTAQYALDIDTSYCSNSFNCYLQVNYIQVQARKEVDGNTVLPDPNFINIKLWSGSDFYMGDNTKLFGNNYGGYWYIGDSLDAWLGTSNVYYSCKDNESQCNFGYWLNKVDYDTNNVYSGLSVSADSEIVADNYIRFYSSPLNLSTGNISPSYYDYDTVLIMSGMADPFVIYLQAYGSDTIETVEDNGTDIANDYYESELEAINSISGQSPNDIDIGNSQTAMSLIDYLSNFIQYIGSVSASNNCELALPLPSIMGGATTANLCQGKDTMGNTISVISSIVSIAFFLPLASALLKIIYNEIRSFTNG